MINNIITRITLGTLLPSTYTTLFLSSIVAIHEAYTSITNLKQLLPISAIIFIITLYCTATPSIILSLLIERANRHYKKNILTYAAKIGFTIGLSYCLLVSLLDLTLYTKNSYTFAVTALFIGGLLGTILGVLTTIPLNKLYKKQYSPPPTITATKTNLPYRL